MTAASTESLQTMVTTIQTQPEVKMLSEEVLIYNLAPKNS